MTLVVIHGWISHLEVYWEQPMFARFMTRLASGMRILHFDKRGTGMSDRFATPPALETRMDDVRAVMDAAGVDRAAMFGWGTGGPQLASFFAATHPARTIALTMMPWVHERWTPDFPFGTKEDDFERELAEDMSIWGDEVRALGYTESQPPADPEFVRWDAKLSRFAATPGSMAALTRMWFETDIRDILPTIRVPTLVVAKRSGVHSGEEAAAYVADRIPGARVAFISTDEAVFWLGDPEPFVTALERFFASVTAEQAELDRVLATVLFTDIVKSTETASDLGDRPWRDLLERHHATVRALLDRYRGREVDTAGDGFLATFDGPARAVRCAEAIMHDVERLGVRIRAGVHTGEVETIDGKVGGIAVNIGARVGALAAPSEILVSQTVKDLVVGSGIVFADRGTHALKGVPGEWRLYAVATPDATSA
jgi:class 3 adenylate cyclase/pimeloyl-ACP methyl ester carboxylesterase